MATEHLVGIASDIVIMSLLALSAWLVLRVGRISFGQQAFFGLGAYAAGLLTAVAGAPLPLALLAAMVVGAAASLLVAFPTLRLAGLPYAVATLAFAEMTRLALQAWHWQVEARDGLVGPAGLEGFRDIRWLLENDVSPQAYLGLAAATLAAVLGALAWLNRTRLGLALQAVGHDDDLAASQGWPVLRLRLLAVALAGALAALGGGLYAHRTTYIEPALFDPMLGVHAVGYALIGGLATVAGPLLGVAFDLGLLEATRLFAGWRMVVFGGLVALFLRWRPRGLLDEQTMQRLSSLCRPAAAVLKPPLLHSRMKTLVLLSLLAALAGPALAQGRRPQVDLACVAYGMGPQLECTVQARRGGAPVDGLQVTLGATMPSMPMAHSVKPVRAVATGRPGEYRGVLALEMSGAWSVHADLAGPLRDRVVRTLAIDECEGDRRCPVAPAHPHKH